MKLLALELSSSKKCNLRYSFNMLTDSMRMLLQMKNRSYRIRCLKIPYYSHHCPDNSKSDIYSKKNYTSRENCKLHVFLYYFHHCIDISKCDIYSKKKNYTSQENYKLRLLILFSPLQRYF